MRTFKYKKGSSVVVTDRHGRKLNGKIVDANINMCTFCDEYDINVILNGRKHTLIGVPECAIS